MRFPTAVFGRVFVLSVCLPVVFGRGCYLSIYLYLFCDMPRNKCSYNVDVNKSRFYIHRKCIYIENEKITIFVLPLL